FAPATPTAAHFVSCVAIRKGAGTPPQDQAPAPSKLRNKVLPSPMVCEIRHEQTEEKVQMSPGAPLFPVVGRSGDFCQSSYARAHAPAAHGSFPPSTDHPTEGANQSSHQRSRGSSHPRNPSAPPARGTIPHSTGTHPAARWPDSKPA